MTTRYWHASNSLFAAFKHSALTKKNLHAAPYGFCFSKTHEEAALQRPDATYLYEVVLDFTDERWFHFDKPLSHTSKCESLIEKMQTIGIEATKALYGHKAYNAIAKKLVSDFEAAKLLKQDRFCGAILRSQDEQVFTCWRISKIKIIAVHFKQNFDKYPNPAKKRRL